MKRKIIAIIIAISVMGTGTLVSASSKAKTYYLSDLSYGTTSAVASTLTSMGYESSVTADPGAADLKKVFHTYKVVHILTHGYSGGGRMKGVNKAISANTIENYYTGNNVTNTSKFVFMEVCYSALTSDTYGSLPVALNNIGVSSSISFRTAISASSSSNGCHYFAKRVYYYLNQGNNISYAVNCAKADTYTQYRKYSGVDSVVVKGGSKYIS